MTTTPTGHKPPHTPARGEEQPQQTGANLRRLTPGQKWVLAPSAILMSGVGIAGAIGTYANAKASLGRSATALGFVAAGEGATLVAALVMIGVTMLGQAAPTIARAALWLLPAAASVMGLAIAPTMRQAIIYSLTPLAMTTSAEGISFLARRIVSYTSDVDVEAQRRNAELLREIAFHAAQAERHPNQEVRNKSALRAWKLMRKIGSGDAQLGSGLIAVQRDRLTEGADAALVAMLTGEGEPVLAQAEPRAIEPGEPTGETAPPAMILPARIESDREPTPPAITDPGPIMPSVDQHVRREPVLIPAEPVLAKTLRTAPETSVGEPGEPETETDEKEQQIVTLAHRLRSGQQLTKTTAAQLLGVSPATAGRRLKDARDRIGDGTGFYA